MKRVFVLLIGLFQACVLMASEVPSAVITVAAESVDVDVAVPLDRLSVMRFNAGKWEAIPFQIDELDEHGLVWFEGSGFAPSGKRGLFDGKDQLLVMQNDLGEKASGLPASGKVLAMIEAATPAGRRWAYLVDGNAERSTRRYVDHDVKTGKTATASYRLDVDPANELNWQFLGYRGYQGGADSSIIESLKMTMSGGLLVNFARITLDNDNLQPRLKGFINGPIRSVMHLETRIVFGGLPMMKMHVQAMRYSNHYEAHTFATIPAVYRASVRKPVVTVAVNGNRQLGASVQTASGGAMRTNVDGSMEPVEKELGQLDLSGNNSWILFDSGRQFTLMARLQLPAELQDFPVSLMYQDDGAEARLPEVGYALHGWPPQDELRFTLQLFFDSSLHNHTPGNYLSRRSGDGIDVTVSSFLATR